MKYTDIDGADYDYDYKDYEKKIMSQTFSPLRPIQKESKRIKIYSLKQILQGLPIGFA